MQILLSWVYLNAADLDAVDREKPDRGKFGKTYRYKDVTPAMWRTSDCSGVFRECLPQVESAVQ